MAAFHLDSASCGTQDGLAPHFLPSMIIWKPPLLEVQASLYNLYFGIRAETKDPKAKPSQHYSYEPEACLFF